MSTWVRETGCLPFVRSTTHRTCGKLGWYSKQAFYAKGKVFVGGYERIKKVHALWFELKSEKKTRVVNRCAIMASKTSSSNETMFGSLE